jgi:hypothetical protein
MTCKECHNYVRCPCTMYACILISAEEKELQGRLKTALGVYREEGNEREIAR